MFVTPHEVRLLVSFNPFTCNTCTWNQMPFFCQLYSSQHFPTRPPACNSGILAGPRFRSLCPLPKPIPNSPGGVDIAQAPSGRRQPLRANQTPPVGGPGWAAAAAASHALHPIPACNLAACNKILSLGKLHPQV